MSTNKDLLKFIRNSATAFQAVETVKEMLNDKGFTELREGDSWKIEKKGKYYTTRNDSSLIAFEIPSGEAERYKELKDAASMFDYDMMQELLDK